MSLPSKTDCMSDMESMIHHFKLITEGIKGPPGDCYFPVEASKGELGMYLVSDGGPKPVRWRVRPPSFVNISVIPKLARGHLISDSDHDQREPGHRPRGDRPMSDVPFKNPGWAGNTGEFDLTEDQVRGDEFVGESPRRRRAPLGLRHLSVHAPGQEPRRPALRGRLQGALREDPDALSEQAGGAAPALGLAQEVRGHVSPRRPWTGWRSFSASPPAYVRGVTTFYTMYNKRPVGRFLVQVCTNISCNLCGADEVMEAFLRYTDTEVGETSEDGYFTVIEAECLAACGFPTCVQINSRYYENVTPAERAEDHRAPQGGRRRGESSSHGLSLRLGPRGPGPEQELRRSHAPPRGHLRGARRLSSAEEGLRDGAGRRHRRGEGVRPAGAVAARAFPRA